MRNDQTLLLDFPANYAFLHVLGAMLGEMVTRVDAVDERDTLAYAIQLAVNEIFTNIVGHAYAGRPDGRVWIKAELVRDPRHLLVELRDEGIAFERAQVPAPDLCDVQIHGYGLFLAEHLLDEVTYLPQAGQNCWRLVKYF